MRLHYQVLFDLSPLPLVYDILSPYKGTTIQILVRLTRGWIPQGHERAIKLNIFVLISARIFASM